MACNHGAVYLDISPNGSKAKFKRPSKSTRLRAAVRADADSPLTDAKLFDDAATFPPPLALPDDDIALDPEWPPQDFAEWGNEPERNHVTSRRRTIYLVASPSISDEMKAMKSWTRSSTTVPPLQVQDCKDYIAAFYHGLPVKILQSPFRWAKWPDTTYLGTPLTTNATRLVGLETPVGNMVGVRCRRSSDGVMQVNLDDVIDALIENTPKDAYAIMMLLDLDMYEGDELFTGGRAYGGSRAGVASSFRDHPARVPDDMGHRWPASHCAEFVGQMCGTHKRPRPLGEGPMHAAIRAVTGLGSEDLYVGWLSRTLQTMTHELGHCFGLDHCVYYACAMQGCASSEEGLRQPPYLCPVCLEKAAWAIAPLVKRWESRVAREAYVRARYAALRDVCEHWQKRGPAAMFKGYAAWLERVLATIQ